MTAEHRGIDLADEKIVVSFEDHALLPMLYGEFDRNLARIEQRLEISMSSRGNTVVISGKPRPVDLARTALRTLYGRLEGGLGVDQGEVDAAIRMAEGAADGALGDPAEAAGEAPVIRTPRRHISPRSIGQNRYMNALFDTELVFGIGPAGTGKTYLAVAHAVSLLLAGTVDRIILSRPAVEAGEHLGFLPGDMRDKVDPYLRPLYDALYDMMHADQVAKRLSAGEIEIAPLAFMRGRTLANAFVILDEAQNTTQVQMKMILTRLGENSRMVVTGDLTQIDLPPGVTSGLQHAVRTVEHIQGVHVVWFNDADVVRHGLVTKIVQAYEGAGRNRAAGLPGTDSGDM